MNRSQERVKEWEEVDLNYKMDVQGFNFVTQGGRRHYTLHPIGNITFFLIPGVGILSKW